nr:MAG TPA_asm: hypothetical protein [Caudoviricetes sp.]
MTFCRSHRASLEVFCNMQCVKQRSVKPEGGKNLSPPRRQCFSSVIENHSIISRCSSKYNLIVKYYISPEANFQRKAK